MSIDPIAACMSYVVFLFSTTCHEAAHAWTALRLGDDTAYRGGQVSLDPVPHVRREPVGMVVVPVLSFLLGGFMMGWASAPYDPEWAARYPRRSAWMAMAGPVANLLLMMIAIFSIHLGCRMGAFEIPDEVGWSTIAVAAQDSLWSFPAAMLSQLFSMNLLLAAFNLLPFPPLDGAAIPLLFLSKERGERYTAITQNMGLIGLVLAWTLFNAIFPSLWRAAFGLCFN